ncbi:MAG: HAD family phosphatase [Lachnospiraceae bacterium]|nr:HAD family phosphatase [Lachnospiraceae bacterium]
MINSIIFDIGRVLIEWDWQGYLSGFHYTEEKQERLAQAVFENPTWKETDRGVWSDEEILQSFIQKAPEYEKEIRMLWEDMGRCVERSPHTDQWIADLKKQGLKVYYLSNYGKTLREKTKEALNFTDVCDGGIFSYEIKEIKPNPAIYEALLKKYSLNANQCLFIDDLQENIQGAKACGIQGIQFTTYAETSEALRNFLNGK